ncbi:MAG: NUDIX domain-containing protein [Bacteroidota bacterium]
MENETIVTRRYGGRTRVRVAGLIFDEAGRLLLIEHAGLYDDRTVWTPPGGEVEFGETLRDGVRREVKEETHLTVEVGELAYVLDFVRPPLHAVSFYFRCTRPAGTLQTGMDPELPDTEQLIRTVRYVPLSELPDYNIVPEGLADWLQRDVPAGFPNAPTYIGTLR